MLISQSLLPAESYVVRGRYIPGGDRPVLWSGFIPVITPNILLSDKDVFVDIDLTGVEEALGWLRNSTRTAQDAIDGLITAQMELATVGYKDTRKLARELSVELGAARAEYREDIQLAVNETMAVAGKVETLTAALGGSSAFVNVAWAAIAAPSGYAARYGVTAAVNDGAYRAASLLLDVPANPALPTRVIVQAGQFVVASDDGSVIKQPFTVTGGVLYANDIRANTLSAFSSVLGNVDISSAYIGTLTVGTSNIDPGAITVVETATMGDITSDGSSFYNLDVTINHGAGSPRILVTGQSYVLDDVGGTPRVWSFVIRDQTGNAGLEALQGSGGSNPISWMAVHNPPSGRTQTTYRLQLQGGSSLKFKSNKIIAMVLKR